MADNLNDLRDDLELAFLAELGPEHASHLADTAIQTITRWVAQEPANDRD